MTALPEPGDSSAGDHAQMARRFLEHARAELQKGNRLQAPGIGKGLGSSRARPESHSGATGLASPLTLDRF